MMMIKIIYEDDNEYYATTNIMEPHIAKHSGILQFVVSNNIWNCCLDFSKGFKKFEIKTAMQFESIYAMRFYEIVSGQKSPITYKIDSLKEMFHQLEDKYKFV